MSRCVTKLLGFRLRRIENRLQTCCSMTRDRLSLLVELLDCTAGGGDRWEIRLRCRIRIRQRLARRGGDVTLGQLQRRLIEIFRRRAVLKPDRLRE
jgi:hypothetical protein